MPAKSAKQRRAAGAELAYRRSHGGRGRGAGAPFGSASTQDVRDFALGAGGKMTRYAGPPKSKKHKPGRFLTSGNPLEHAQDLDRDVLGAPKKKPTYERAVKRITKRATRLGLDTSKKRIMRNIESRARDRAAGAQRLGREAFEKRITTKRPGGRPGGMDLMSHAQDINRKLGMLPKPPRKRKKGPHFGGNPPGPGRFGY